LLMAFDYVNCDSCDVDVLLSEGTKIVGVGGLYVVEVMRKCKKRL